MTKKDYIKLANIIDKHTSVTEPDRITRQSFINALCDVLKADNPRFDADRFIKACK